MVLLKRRSRLVTFRVSADEYQELSNGCLSAGARSIAEFAREAVLQNVQAARMTRGTLSGDLATVSKALSELDTSLHDMRRMIRSVLGSVASEEPKATVISGNEKL
jgi:hypothetical protein